MSGRQRVRKRRQELDPVLEPILPMLEALQPLSRRLPFPAVRTTESLSAALTCRGHPARGAGKGPSSELISSSQPPRTGGQGAAAGPRGEAGGALCGLAAPLILLAGPGEPFQPPGVWGCAPGTRGSDRRLLGAPPTPPSAAPTVFVPSPPHQAPHCFPCRAGALLWVRGCPSRAAALSLPARLQHARNPSSIPLISSLQGSEGAGILPRGRGTGLQLGRGLWQPGTPPWTMSLGTRGCHAQCLPAWAGGVKPVLPPKLGHFFLGIS